MSQSGDMGCRLAVLLCALAPAWGSSALSQGNVTFRCLQISSLANSTCWRTDGLAWLGDQQTHAWSNGSDAIRLLKPWARGTFSGQQWDKLQHILQVYRSSFTRDIREFSKMLGKAYPLELQVSAGCAADPAKASGSFLHAALGGKHVLSFRGTSFEPAPDAPVWVHLVTAGLNKDQGTRETVQLLLSDTCPQLVVGLLEAGKSELEKQVKPEAWLSSGPSPGPGRLQLVCHASGFYPRPVQVMWMRGEQEQPGTQRGDVLPNADETWYLRAALEVVAGEAAGLSCRIKHSSLGGQDIVLHWDGRRPSAGLIVLAVVVCLVFLFGVILSLTFWIRRCHSYQGIL